MFSCFDRRVPSLRSRGFKQKVKVNPRVYSYRRRNNPPVRVASNETEFGERTSSHHAGDGKCTMCLHTTYAIFLDVARKVKLSKSDLLLGGHLRPIPSDTNLRHRHPS